MRRPARSIFAPLVPVVLVVPLTLSATVEGGEDVSSGMTLRSTLDVGQTTAVAFWGTTAVIARRGDADPRDDGFSVVDISRPDRPSEIGRFRCVGSSYDISIWEDLVFLSVDGTRGGGWDGTGCQASPVAAGSPGSFAGIRVVSIEDPTAPVQLAAVPTNCGLGSHTHTPLPDPPSDPTRLLIYSNLACETLVEVPLDSPADAGVVEAFTFPDIYCHDFTIFLPGRLGACSSVATHLLDLSDPVHPVTLSVIANGASVAPSTSHSSAFSWDGRTLAIGDEINSPKDFFGFPDCHAGSDDLRGRIWFHDITNPRLPIFRGSYQLPQRVTQGRYCSAHYFSVVPVKGDRDILTSAWFGEGVTVVDFTDPSDPRQLAHFTAAPQHPTRHAFAYDALWYNGSVYATNSPVEAYGETSTTRSLDVFAVDDGILPPWRCVSALNAQTQIGPEDWRKGPCPGRSGGESRKEERRSRAIATPSDDGPTVRS